VNLRDLARFLGGDRGAIERLAGTRHALWVGALFVLAASLARNHDGAWLPGEPWVLLHGLAISAFNATILFTLVFAAAALRRLARPGFWPGLLSFLGLFWLTAPMGWVYAIPYEHFMTPVDAVGANAWTLALVSLWRVLLITRVLSVLWGAGFVRCLFLVLLFADAVLIAAVAASPAPVVDFMGGMQHAPEEQALAAINFMVAFFAVLLSPVLLIGAIVAAVRLKGGWRVTPSAAAVSHGVVVAVTAAFAGFAALLALFQPAQHRRFEATRLLRDDPSAGMAYMSRFDRDAFPPVWDPPPRLAYRETEPPIPAIHAALNAGAATRPWVRTLFLDKSWRALGGAGNLGPRTTDPTSFADHHPREAATPEMIEIVRFHAEHDDRLSPEAREALHTWLAAPPAPKGPAAGQPGG